MSDEVLLKLVRFLCRLRSVSLTVASASEALKQFLKFVLYWRK